MAIVAGIDEAGYGPVLGPLVVSLAAFEVPDELVGQSLWTQLAGSVSAKVSRRDARLPIVDSKKLHHSADGLAAVERTALAMLAVGDSAPGTFRELIRAVCPRVESALGGYAWYGRFEEALPLECDATCVRLHANAVRRTLREAGIRFIGPRCCVLPAGHYNRLIESTRNKATVLWTLTLKLISQLMQLAGERALHIYIDRQGARTRYARPLLTAFEDADLQVLDESDECSRYVLRFANGRAPRGPVTIEFRQSGESAHLPTALASIYSKYLRELFMVALNRYWQQQVGDLRRTAGYYQDGLRFLRDIEPAIRSLDVDRRLLVRSR